MPPTDTRSGTPGAPPGPAGGPPRPTPGGPSGPPPNAAPAGPVGQPGPSGVASEGDLVVDPVGLGRDVVLRVDRVTGDIAWVVGDAFEDATPWPLNDLTVLEGSEGIITAMESAVRRVGAILQDPAGGFLDDTIARIEKGLETLAPDVQKTGIPSLVLTYRDLMRIISDVKHDPRFDPGNQELERGSSREP